MKIVLDPQIFIQQRFGGISRYYCEIFLNISKNKDIEVILPLYSSTNVYLAETNLLVKKRFWKQSLIFVLNKIGVSTRKMQRKANEDLVNSNLQNSNFDVFVPTYYDTYFLDKIGNKPFVLTVYDMIHEIFPQYFLNDLSTAKNKKSLIEKSTKIIAISESTKADIIKFNPEINVSKIEVIYLSQSVNLKSKKTLDLPEKYILFVGNRDFYKNFNFFIRSIANYLLQNKKLFIICAGGNKFSLQEIEFLKEFKIADQVTQMSFEEDELALFYKNAACFVFPSEYEGFGIPVLEAMACGCPVVLAKHSSFIEVAADAGVFFELNNANDLVNKIDSLLNNKNFRNEIIDKGYVQSNKFSWIKTANECLKVYQQAINKC